MTLTSLFVAVAIVAQAPLSAQNADAYLKSLRAKEPNYLARVATVAKACLGTPYEDGPLGEGPGAAHDTDPLIDLDHVDCVTYVEQVLALAAANNLADATTILQKIRYKDGVIDYGTRNHFFIADWVVNNTFAKDITDTLKVEPVRETRTIGRRKFFELTKAPEYLPDAKDESLTLGYIAVAKAGEAETALPDLAIIVFIGKPSWLFASHCGLFIRENGKGLLYHASSVKKEVIAVPFADYVKSNSKIVGFTAYAIDPARIPTAK